MLAIPVNVRKLGSTRASVKSNFLQKMAAYVTSTAYVLQIKDMV
jgi:hypothetical protein